MPNWRDFAFTICAIPLPASAPGAAWACLLSGKLLGHANPTTTARYAHLDADPLRRASERIGSTIAAAMGETTKPEGAKVIRLAK